MLFRLRKTIALWAIVVFAICACRAANAQQSQFDAFFAKATELGNAHKDREALGAYADVEREKKQSEPEAAAEALYRAMVYSDTRYGITADERKQGHKTADEFWQQLSHDYPASQAARNGLDFQLKKAEEKGGLEALSEQKKVAQNLQRQSPELAAEALYQAGLFASERIKGTDEEKHQGETEAVDRWKQLAADFPTTEAAARLRASTPDAPKGKLIALEERINKRNSGSLQYQILDVLVRATGKQSWSYGLALLLLAFMVKAITFPLTKRQYKSLAEMQRMAPLIKELQKKYKGADLHQKTMELYKEHKVNPAAGCIPIVIMMPFLIFVFGAIRLYEYAFAHGSFLWIGSALSQNSNPLVPIPFMSQPVSLFGRTLAEPDVMILIIYGLTNYVTMKMTPASDPQQQQSQSMMAVMTSLFLPWMFLSSRWSSAFVLYWTIQNLLTIWQQYELVVKPARLRNAQASVVTEAGTVGNGVGAQPSDSREVLPPGKVRPRKRGKR